MIAAPFTSFKSFFFYCYGAHRILHSFPTRRSSDLRGNKWVAVYLVHALLIAAIGFGAGFLFTDTVEEAVQVGLQVFLWGVVVRTVFVWHISWCAAELDRKSTRLNSSHVSISYAVFC